MSLREVSNILWRERQLLELLVFKLDEEQLVLASGRARRLSHATREVETILGEIRRIELERAMAVAGAVSEPGFPDAPSSPELAAIAPTPRNGIFAERRRALITLAQEIEAITRANRELLQRGRQAVREARASLGELDIDSYDAGGAIPDRSLALRLVDRVVALNGADAKDVQTRNAIQVQSVRSLGAAAERSCRGQHRRRDDQHGRVPSGVRSVRGEPARPANDLSDRSRRSSQDHPTLTRGLLAVGAHARD